MQQNPRVEIKRTINAPPERVYAAWTDPEQLRQWFGPDCSQTRNLAADVCVGGRFRWDLISCDGKEVTVEGEYRELEPNRRIVFTWQNPGDPDWKEQVSIVTVELAGCENGTELRLTHVQLPSEASRARHKQGWDSVIEHLQQFVDRPAS